MEKYGHAYLITTFSARHMAEQDRPGMIATIANTLSDHQINIKDIEVLKVREDEGGTMRLAFSTLDIAQKAIGLLSAEGLTARLRE